MWLLLNCALNFITININTINIVLQFILNIVWRWSWFCWPECVLL